MVAAAGAHFGLELAPLQAPLATYVGEGFLDPGLHTFQAADVDVGCWAREQCRDRMVFSADPILHVLLVRARNSREHQMLLEQAIRNFLKWAEVGKLLRRTRTKKHDELTGRR